jgi:hypothetical protein
MKLVPHGPWFLSLNAALNDFRFVLVLYAMLVSGVATVLVMARDALFNCLPSNAVGGAMPISFTESHCHY